MCMPGCRHRRGLGNLPISQIFIQQLVAENPIFGEPPCELNAKAISKQMRVVSTKAVD